MFGRPERKICYSLDESFVGESIKLNESLRHSVTNKKLPLRVTIYNYSFNSGKHSKQIKSFNFHKRRRLSEELSDY